MRNPSTLRILRDDFVSQNSCNLSKHKWKSWPSVLTEEHIPKTGNLYVLFVFFLTLIFKANQPELQFKKLLEEISYSNAREV